MRKKIEEIIQETSKIVAVYLLQLFLILRSGLTSWVKSSTLKLQINRTKKNQFELGTR